MAVTVNGSAPTTEQKQQMREAFDLVGFGEDGLIPAGPPRDAVREVADEAVAAGSGSGNLTDVSNAVMRLYRSLSAVADGGTGSVTLLQYGDSIAQYATTGIVQSLVPGIGQKGFALGAYGGSNLARGVSYMGPTHTTSGDVIVPDGGATAWDFTYYPTGTHWDIGSGGVVNISSGGGVVTGTTFAVYYVKRPGGGTMTFDLLDSGNAVQSTQSVDTNNASVALGIATFTVTQAARKLRLTGTSGRCIYLGPKMLDTTIGGLVLVGLSRGGLGLDQAVSANSTIFNALIADLSPTLITYSARETDAIVTANLPTLLNRFANASPNADYVLLAPNEYGPDQAYPAGSSPSYLEAEAVKAVAADYGYALIDTRILLPDPDRLANKADVHLSADEGRWVAQQVVRALGLDAFASLALSARRMYAQNMYAQQINITSAYQQNQNGKVAGAGLKIATAGDNDSQFTAKRNHIFSVNGDDAMQAMRLELASSQGNAVFRASVPTGYTSGTNFPGAGYYVGVKPSNALYTTRCSYTVSGTVVVGDAVLGIVPNPQTQGYATVIQALDPGATNATDKTYMGGRQVVMELDESTNALKISARKTAGTLISTTLTLS